MKEIFSSLGCLGWAMAVIFGLALALTIIILRRAELDLDAAQKQIKKQERENTNLNAENDRLCADNLNLEQRNKMLIERIAELEPKADELDKLAERQTIVQAAYDQHAQKLKCPTATYCKRDGSHVSTWPIHLN
jgi:cell division protein FtsB